MARQAKEVTLYNDTLEVAWNGSVWVSPTNGGQHVRPEDAMRYELRFYFRESGDNPDDPETAARIEKHLTTMRDAR